MHGHSHQKASFPIQEIFSFHNLFKLHFQSTAALPAAKQECLPPTGISWQVAVFHTQIHIHTSGQSLCGAFWKLTFKMLLLKLPERVYQSLCGNSDRADTMLLDHILYCPKCSLFPDRKSCNASSYGTPEAAAKTCVHNATHSLVRQPKTGNQELIFPSQNSSYCNTNYSLLDSSCSISTGRNLEFCA